LRDLKTESLLQDLRRGSVANLLATPANFNDFANGCLLTRLFHPKIRLRMRWRCPACREQIPHDRSEATPRLGVIYRCQTCRLELVFDEQTRRLTMAPMGGHAPEPAPAKPRPK